MPRDGGSATRRPTFERVRRLPTSRTGLTICAAAFRYRRSPSHPVSTTSTPGRAVRGQTRSGMLEGQAGRRSLMQSFCMTAAERMRGPLILLVAASEPQARYGSPSRSAMVDEAGARALARASAGRVFLGQEHRAAARGISEFGITATTAAAADGVPNHVEAESMIRNARCRRALRRSGPVGSPAPWPRRPRVPPDGVVLRPSQPFTEPGRSRASLSEISWRRSSLEASDTAL